MRMRRPAAMLFDLLTGDESLGRRGGGAGRGADQRGPLAVPVFPTNWIGPASAGGSATDSAMVSSIERLAPPHRQPPRSRSNGIAKSGARRGRLAAGPLLYGYVFEAVIPA